MRFRKSRRLALIAVAAAALALLASGWALATHFAGHVTSTGKAQLSQTNQSSNGATEITSPTFSTLNGTSTTVVVPAGQTRLVNARWVGEALATAMVYMRIGAIKGGTFTEFNPVDGSQTLVSSGHGSQAVERSRTLGPGTYTVVAQVRKNGGQGLVGEWHFAVQVIAT